MRVVCVIPARGSSKRFPNKNISFLCGRPLISYAISNALHSVNINEVYVSSDSEEIIGLSKEYGAQVPVVRPKRLATDDSPVIESIKHMINYCEKDGSFVDVIVLLQPTSPLISSEQIDSAVELLIENKVDSVVSVAKVATAEHPFNVRHENKDGYLRFCNEELHKINPKPPIYKAAGMWVCRRKLVMDFSLLEGTTNLGYLVDFPCHLDIDYENDLKLIEAWMKYNGNSNSIS